MFPKLLLSCLLLTFFFVAKTQSVDDLVVSTVEVAEELRKQKGDILGAIDTLRSVLTTLEKEERHPPLSLVPLYHKLGVNYYLYGDNAKALKYTRQALNIRESAYGKTHIDVARGYYLRAILSKELQLYEGAEEDLNQAISSMSQLLAQKESTDTFRLIWMYEESIRLHSILRNNTLALQFWNKTYDYYAKDISANFSQIISLYNNKGHIYYNQQKYTLSEKAYLEAITLYEANNEPSSELEAIAIVYSDLGLVQFKQAKFEQAERNYRIALAHFKELLGEGDSPWYHQKIGVVYGNLLELAGKREESESVEDFFAAAFSYYTKGFGTFYHPLIASLYLDKSEIEYRQGNYQQALILNQESLRALIPDYTTTDALRLVSLDQYVIKDKLSFLSTLRQKAQILYKIQQEESDVAYLQAAFKNYQILDTVITQIRQSYQAAGSQFELIEQSYPIYEEAILTALTLFERTEKPSFLAAAYHFAAKNKALVLLGGIQEEQAKSFSSIPDNLKAEERRIKKAIFELEAKLYEQAKEILDPQLKDSLFSLQREHQQLIRHFETDYPDYYEAKYGFDRGITVPQLQEQLAANDAILEYFVGEQQLYIFLITKTAFSYTQQDKPVAFEGTTASLRNRLQEKTNSSETFATLSHQLYQWLLADPLQELKSTHPVNHLVIIPDGVLLQLPFDVLLQDVTSPSPNYLLLDYAISYAYSNRLLFADHSTGQDIGVFAGFGLEYDDYTLAGLSDYTTTDPNDTPTNRALGKLQYSDDEIAEIASLLGGEQWLNSGATRQAFLENAGHYAIVHLATHGLLNQESPMNSALVFSRQNDTTDYLLRAADLYNLQLNAEMAVLSACNTGAGTLQKGEGVRSLARAFSYAGCPSLIASLWNASDKSTKDISVDFYRNLQQGMTKHEAMQKAKLAYLKTASPAYQSPYYWSHLSVIGDSGKLEVFERQNNYWLWLLAGLGAVGLLLFWRSQA